MEKVIYRIYTQKQKKLIPLVKAYFNYATIYEGIGIFKGVSEKCSIIEVIASNNPIIYDTIINLAKIIKIEYNQESVLVTVQDIEIINE